jgi:hypothetical protein
MVNNTLERGGGRGCDIAGVRATTDSNLTGGGGGRREKTQGKHNSPERCCVASPYPTEAAALYICTLQCAVRLEK